MSHYYLNKMRLRLAIVVPFVVVASTFLDVCNNNVDFFCHGWQQQQSTRTRSNRFIWQPSQVHLKQVWQSYPETAWRKLFSSVPRRPYALSNVTIEIQGGQFLIIQGASSSGKSTILRLVAGMEQPVKGNVTIVATIKTPAALSAKPVYLGQKEFPYQNFRVTMKEMVKRVIIDHELKVTQPSVKRNHDGNMYDRSDKTDHHKMYQAIAHEVANQLAQYCNLDKSTSDLTLNGLSPSEFYRWGLVIASLQSVLPSIATATGPTTVVTATTAVNNDQTGVTSLQVPAPILLLDEWMDLETSGIVQTVETCLVRLTQDVVGAVILCVTHKPNLFGLHLQHPTITMCRGEVLSCSNF